MRRGFLTACFLPRACRYSDSRLSISLLGTARTCFTKSSNALNSFGFLMPSSYAFRAAAVLGWIDPGAQCFLFPGYLFVGETSSNDASEREQEAVAVITKTLIETKRFFVEIAERVKRFNRHVRTLDAAF